MSAGRGRAPRDRRARFKGDYMVLHTAGRGRGSPLFMGEPAAPGGWDSEEEHQFSNAYETPFTQLPGAQNLRDSRDGSFVTVDEVGRGVSGRKRLEYCDSLASGGHNRCSSEEEDDWDLDRKIQEAQERLNQAKVKQNREEKRQKLRDLERQIQSLEGKRNRTTGRRVYEEPQPCSSKRVYEEPKLSSSRRAYEDPQPSVSRRVYEEPQPSTSRHLTNWLLDEESHPLRDGQEESNPRSKWGFKTKYIDEGASSCFSGEDQPHSGKKGGKIRSGMAAKQVDAVRYPQLWAHAEVMEELGGKELTFQEINFRQLVTGELEIIIEGNISDTERESRQELLRLLGYLYGVHEWRVVKGVYAYIISKIEKGRLQWGDSLVGEVQWALARRGGATQPNTSAKKRGTAANSGNSDRVWFCQGYQKGLCPLSSGHEAVVNGRTVVVQHVCAKCLQKDRKKVEHPEKDCVA